MVRQSLVSAGASKGAAWTVRGVGDLGSVPEELRARVAAGVPATVPGCVHTDLMDAGVIADPAVGDGEARCQWVSLLDWRHECAFEAEAGLFEHHEIDLCFECLDTIARVELNGDLVGEAASEHVPWRFGVLGLLKPGRNVLAVTFKSAVRHVREEAARLGALPVNGDWDPFVYARKCASNFRWDWGPAVATCGVSGEVELVSGRGASPLRPRRAPATSPAGSGGGWMAGVQWPFCRGVNWIPEGLWPRDRTPERVRARLEALRDANVNMIRVWGGGRYEPDWFYELCTELGIMVWQDFMFTCGCYPEEEPYRSLVEREARHQVARLSRHPCVVLWCGGNECIWAHDNWGFKEKLAPGRAWGAGYYLEMLPGIVGELSGAPYWPNSPWTGVGDSAAASERAEGRAEDSQGAGADQSSSGAAPLAPFPPPLPSGKGSLEEAPRAWLFCNDPERGDRHTWDVWGEGYRGVVPRFCSEFGQQSPSCWATLEEAGLIQPGAPATGLAGARGELEGGAVLTESRCLGSARESGGPATGSADLGNGPDPVAGAPGCFDSEAIVPPLLLARQRGPGDPFSTPTKTPMQRWYDAPMSAWFKPTRSLERWHYLAQLLQARCMAIGIEWMRANMDRCHGALLWQANDAWPGFSWSIIDSAGRKKLAYYSVKRAFADRLLSVHPVDGRVVLFAVNDTDEVWSGTFEAARVGIDGRVLRETKGAMQVRARSPVHAADLTALLGPPADPTRELVVVRADGVDAAWYFFVPDRELELPRAGFGVEVRKHAAGCEVRVTAQTVVKDLCVIADRLGTSVESDTQLVTMLPGEKHTFVLRGAKADATAVRRVMCSAGDAE